MYHFLPETQRRLSVGIFVPINSRSLPNEVNLIRCNIVCFVDNFSSNEENHAQNLHTVALKICLHVHEGLNA